MYMVFRNDEMAFLKHFNKNNSRKNAEKCMKSTDDMMKTTLNNNKSYQMS